MPRHGAVSTYTNHGCRCDACSLAWRDYAREYKRRKRSDKDFKQRERSSYRSRVAECKQRLGGKCVSCGAVENLEFDHVDPQTKTANITDLAKGPRAHMLLELEKCQLLCRSCHLEKTRSERRPVSHGTPLQYSRSCRCDACRKAMAIKNRDYYLARKARLANA